MLKKIASAILVIGVVLATSGCSTVEFATGADYASLDHSLNDSSKKVSKVTKAEFTEGKSYVVYIAETKENRYDHPSALFEVVNGKVVLAGLISKRPGRMIMEVNPGIHTYLQRSSCGVYTITIDVKKGYGYYISRSKTNLGKPSLMAYCENQGYFSYMSYIDEVNVYSNYKNYILVPENIALANRIVDNAGIQSEYEDFIEDIDDIRKNRKLILQRQVDGDLGFEVGSRL